MLRIGFLFPSYGIIAKRGRRTERREGKEGRKEKKKRNKVGFEEQVMGGEVLDYESLLSVLHNDVLIRQIFLKALSIFPSLA